MKYFAPLIAVGMMLSAMIAGPIAARGDDGDDCNAQPDRSYHIERSMGIAYQADDYVSAYIDARRAAELRGECVVETTGDAVEWHLIYQATDLYAEAMSAKLSGVYPEQYANLLAAAKSTLADAKNNLVGATMKRAYNEGRALIYGS